MDIAAGGRLGSVLMCGFCDGARVVLAARVESAAAAFVAWSAAVVVDCPGCG